jgi:RNA polymerase sigma-70 factor (ECF subfamily)
MVLQTDISLADLVARIAEAQDRQAFALLFRYFAPRIKAYVMRAGADSAAAEEIMQEVMLAVWRRAGQFNPNLAAVSTWVFTIARNKRIDALRRERFPVMEGSDQTELPDTADAADHLHDLSESTARLLTAMRALPPTQSALLEMAYFHDKSHHAIANETKLPLGTVKSRIRLGLSKLRDALKD